MGSSFERSATPQNPYMDPALMESDADKSFSQSTLQQTSQKQLRSNDSAIDQREKEINDIAKGIIELADIFKDLQTMVIDQGTMLDRIDYNVEKMAVDVKAADKELITVSSTYSRSTVSYVASSNSRFFRQLATKSELPSGRYYCFFCCW
jgi:syntaxin 16